MAKKTVGIVKKTALKKSGVKKVVGKSVKKTVSKAAKILK